MNDRTQDTFCTANVGTASSDGYIACAADKSAPLHNPHDVEHFQHEYRSDYPHRAEAPFHAGQRVYFGQHGAKLFAATVVAVPRTWTEKRERTSVVYDGDDHVSFALTEALHAE